MSGNWWQKRRRVAATILIGWLVGGTGPASACTARIHTVSTSPVVYDAFSPTPVDGRVRVTLQLVDGDDCNFGVTLSDAAGAPAVDLPVGGARNVLLRPRMLGSSGISQGASDAEARITLSKASPRSDVEWAIHAEGDGVLPPGDINVPILIVVAGSDIATPTSATFSVRSPPRAEVNIAGAAGAFSAGSDVYAVDLGELRNGSSARAFVQFRSNTRAQLTLTSRNRGALQQVGGPGRVPYRFDLDGREVQLNQQAQLPIPAAPTLRGSAMEVRVTTPDVTGAAAGRYEDTISIEVSPLAS